MKKKIFNKMKDYGWSLEDFDVVYNWHYSFINRLCDVNKDNDYDFNVINNDFILDMVIFISDFLRAVNDLESELSESI